MFGRVSGRRRTLHGGLVAVPLVGYPGTLFGYVVHAGAPRRFWLDFAIAMNGVAVLGALAAALAGTAGLRKRVPDAGPARHVAVGHALLNAFAFVLFAVNLGVYAGRWGDGGDADPSAGVTLSALGLAAAFGAFGMGRSLVTDYNVAPGMTPGTTAGATADSTAVGDATVAGAGSAESASSTLTTASTGSAAAAASADEVPGSAAAAPNPGGD